MTSFTTPMLTRTTEDPCVGTSAPYISQSGNTITVTPQNCEYSAVLVRTTPASTMVAREFIYTAPFNITEDTYISAFNVRAGYKLGDEAGGKLYEHEIENVPFYIQNNSKSVGTVIIKKDRSYAPTLTIYSSTDNVSWSSAGSTSTNDLSISVPAQGRLYLRCSATKWYNYSSSNYGGNHIECNVAFSVGGNIMSLLYSDNYVGKTSFPSGSTYTFSCLLKDDNRLGSASELILPATTLASSCYNSMFYGCEFLRTAPVLPATSLTTGCYAYMFQGCTRLNYIKAMFTTTPSSAYTSQWVDGVAATGTFVKNASASWNPSSYTGVSGVPSGWTVQTASS